MEMNAGSLLGGRFRLEKPVGRGAMGRVWQARDTRLDDELVALKILNQELAGSANAVADLKREVLLARKLRHPNILAVYTFWEAEEARFVTMEYVQGRNLAEALRERTSPFSLAEVLPWLGRMCEALDYAHCVGVFHRDIKPANILLGQDGQVHLADFGIARTAEELRAQITGHVTTGTLLFMSPEQLMGEPIDARSDLYSLASSFYELVSGTPPFHTGSIITQIQLKPPPAIPHLPSAVNAVFLKALAKKPDDRHPSCGAFWEEMMKAARAEGAIGTETDTHAPAPLSIRHASPDMTTIELPTPERMDPHRRLGQLLLDARVVGSVELETALEEQKRTHERLGTVLARLGFAAEEAVARALEKQLRIHFIRLDETAFDRDAVRMIKRPLAEKARCVAIQRQGDLLVVAMADPLDLAAINVIEDECGLRVEPRIATESDVVAAIKRVYTNQGGAAGA